jgi:glycosyltransferase involved in cell wall biosynthesis
MKIAAVTTYNSRCGIAEYSAHLYEAMGRWAHVEFYADTGVEPVDRAIETRVHRTWANYRSAPVDGLLDSLDKSDAEVVHIQYNFGFFKLPELGRLVREASSRRPVVLTFHRTIDLDADGAVERIRDYADDLRQAAAIIVHQESDRRRLATAGLDAQIILHGTEPVNEIDRDDARRRHGFSRVPYIIGTYGFLLPHKGLPALLAAVSQLRHRGVNARLVATCAIHPDSSSAAHVGEVRAEIERLELSGAVELVTDFLPPERSRDLLATADVLVLPYSHTYESASGALRSVLPLARPLITTRLPVFEDILPLIPSVPAPARPSDLADELERLWLDPSERAAIARRVRQFAEQTEWKRIAAPTRELYVSAARSSPTCPASSSEHGSSPFVAAQ